MSGEEAATTALAWPDPATVASCYDAAAAHDHSGALALPLPAVLQAAAACWPGQPVPRHALLRAFRAVVGASDAGAATGLDRDGLSELLHHVRAPPTPPTPQRHHEIRDCRQVVVSLEVLTELEGGSGAWRCAASADDYRLTLQQFAAVTAALGCDGGTSPGVHHTSLLERCGAVFGAMPSHDGGLVLLDDLVTWLAPQRLQLGVAARERRRAQPPEPEATASHPPKSPAKAFGPRPRPRRSPRREASPPPGRPPWGSGTIPVRTAFEARFQSRRTPPRPGRETEPARRRRVRKPQTFPSLRL